GEQLEPVQLVELAVAAGPLHDPEGRWLAGGCGRYVADVDGRLGPAHERLRQGRNHPEPAGPVEGWGCGCRVDVLNDARVRRLVPATSRQVDGTSATSARSRRRA